MNIDIILAIHFLCFIVPIGFIYTQLPSQPEPSVIWPQVTWTETTSEYSGLFFRAHGGDSEDFETIQNDNIPRINSVEYTSQEQTDYPGFIDIPNEGWSSWIKSAYNDHYTATWKTFWRYALRFHMTGGEVRPKNTAVRIWKLTA